MSFYYPYIISVCYFAMKSFFSIARMDLYSPKWMELDRSIDCRYIPLHEDGESYWIMYKGFVNEFESNNCFINSVLQVDLFAQSSSVRCYFISQNSGGVFETREFSILLVIILLLWLPSHSWRNEWRFNGLWMYNLRDESKCIHNPLSTRPSNRICEIQMLCSPQSAFDKHYCLKITFKWMRWEMPLRPM